MKYEDLQVGDLVRGAGPFTLCGAAHISGIVPCWAVWVDFPGIGNALIEREHLEYWRGPTIMDWEKVE